MKKYQKIAVLLATLLLLAGGGWFLYQSGFFQVVNSLEELRAYIVRFAPYSHLLFFLVQFLSVVLAPIPSNITAAAGGVLFGTWPAFLLTFGAVAAGSLLVFFSPTTCYASWPGSRSCPSGTLQQSSSSPGPGACSLPAPWAAPRWACPLG